MKFKTPEYKKAEFELKLVNGWASKVARYTDEQLKSATISFKSRLQAGETLDDIRVEVFAICREATRRVLKKWPYDVQVLGGLVLDYGSVAEMKTGEGKTITSIAPVYLNALSGEGVIVSTVNEYLSQRDAEELGEVYNFLGLTVGVNLRDLDKAQKKIAYAQDITYSVHSEIGFDYLRDNMSSTLDEKVQRGLNFVLIDEVDSILIDEAKTPLIVSGGEKNASQLYMMVDYFVKSLKKDEYDIDAESKGIQLNEIGIERANKYFKVKNIFDIENSETVHRIQNALRANKVMFRDAEYIVVDGKIALVDQFTGRLMEGRSYSDGLQQAIQAKEKVEVEPETKTLATVTYQNLFRMFKKLSGMTGTGKTEEKEFIEIYNMRVVEIPTNLPILRKDHRDLVFSDAKYKYEALVQDIQWRFEKGQPVLVGTIEVSESEKISKMLKKINIPHTVLNAKQNESEAEIISKAGITKAITIATNMAGRGTDIKPDKESLKAGGLYVIGTNKAESRRIDNQLKGRSGRQGDIGESRFYLSLDDQLISRFSNQDRLKKSFAKVGAAPIPGKSIIKALNRAQEKIEGFNFDSRKNILQYDDVIRQQRDLIYSQRDIIISGRPLAKVINRMMFSVTKEIISFENFIKKDNSIDFDKLVKSINGVWFALVEYKLKADDIKHLSKEDLVQTLGEILNKQYLIIRDMIIEKTDKEFLGRMERDIITKTFDQNWQVHIDMMTKLRSNSSLSAYAQKNPFQVYVEKGTGLFQEMLKRISHNTVRLLMNNNYARTNSTQPARKLTPEKLNQIKQASIKAAIEIAIGKARKQINEEHPDVNIKNAPLRINIAREDIIEDAKIGQVPIKIDQLAGKIADTLSKDADSNEKGEMFYEVNQPEPDSEEIKIDLKTDDHAIEPENVSVKIDEQSLKVDTLDENDAKSEHTDVPSDDAPTPSTDATSEQEESISVEVNEDDE